MKPVELEAARQLLERRQNELLECLLGSAPAPRGFDPVALERCRQGLAQKRWSNLLRRWPLFAKLGGKGAERFREYARRVPLEANGAANDGPRFLREVMARPEGFQPEELIEIEKALRPLGPLRRFFVRFVNLVRRNR